jgi:hypothetical protein
MPLRTNRKGNTHSNSRWRARKRDKPVGGCLSWNLGHYPIKLHTGSLQETAPLRSHSPHAPCGIAQIESLTSSLDSLA